MLCVIVLGAPGGSNQREQPLERLSLISFLLNRDEDLVSVYKYSVR